MTDAEQAPGATAEAWFDVNCSPFGYGGWRLTADNCFVPGDSADVARVLGDLACYEPDRVVVRPHDALPYTWVAEAFKGDTLLARKSADSPREAAALLAKLIR